MQKLGAEGKGTAILIVSRFNDCISLHTPQQTNYRRLKGWWNSMIQTGANEAKEREQKFMYTI
jgi:hypothetical protein